MLLCSGPLRQRTLNLNRWQQSQAHPAEFICHFYLKVYGWLCVWCSLCKNLWHFLPISSKWLFWQKLHAIHWWRRHKSEELGKESYSINTCPNLTRKYVQYMSKMRAKDKGTGLCNMEAQLGQGSPALRCVNDISKNMHTFLICVLLRERVLCDLCPTLRSPLLRIQYLMHRQGLIFENV